MNTMKVDVINRGGPFSKLEIMRLSSKLRQSF